MSATPIFIVRDTGAVERLGTLHATEQRLALERSGFPFLGPGLHTYEGDLPWICWDMCPSGFLGRTFSERFPELRLPQNPQHWSADDCLNVLSRRGEELTGNLLFGEESRERFEQLPAFLPQGRRTEIDALDALMAEADGLLAAAMTSPGSSSAGGERPKFVLRRGNIECVVKYSPPLNTSTGRRWADLLWTEGLAGLVLRQRGVSSASSGCLLPPALNRAFLLSWRFDRVPSTKGRVGAATLQWLATSRGQAERSGPEVMRSLAGDGLVPQGDAETCELVHAFSAAIGNNDAHLGNYGLTFDAAGAAHLAPIYDVLPMVLAPRFDELPDAHLTPRSAPIDPRVAAWVDELVELVEHHPEISTEFKTLWKRWLSR